MPVVSRVQAGAKMESTFGTAVVVDRFWPFVSDSVLPLHESVESESMGFGELVKPDSIEPPIKLGAAGDIVVEVFTKSFGWWLLPMLGTLGTAGPSGDGAYTHTGTMGTLKSDSFTYQSNRPLHPSDADQAFTFEGGKILSWKIEFEVRKPVKITFNCFFEDYSTATALASRSLAAGINLLTWAQTLVTIGGSSIAVKKGSIECDNGFVIDEERYLRDSAVILEPQQRKRREVKWELDLDHIDLTQFNRFAATAVASKLAQIVARAQGPAVIGGTTYPSLSVTVDSARFDQYDAPVAGPGPIVQKIGGVGLFDLTDSPVTAAYVSADSTA